MSRVMGASPQLDVSEKDSIPTLPAAEGAMKWFQTSHSRLLKVRISSSLSIFGWAQPRCKSRIIGKCFRNLGWLVCVALIPGLASGACPADAEPVVHGPPDFHHTDWNGLGAVFDIKQSSEGYLWLTTSKGVLRFDGVRFQSVEEVTRGAVRDNEIDSVFLSSSGGSG